MQNDEPTILVCQIEAAETRSLRHQVLRPNQPLEACCYPGDDDSNTAHFGAFIKGMLVGIISLYQQAPPQVETAEAWRVRGMATQESLRSRGYGSLLLQTGMNYVKKSGGSFLWCNARESAMPFYKQHNFEVEGNCFELPGIGPHYLMKCQINSV